ncbi:uncharacterized protein YukJ [Paenibacillus mucilaginosus]|uniref:DUF2278 family protein n=1 Tax=Paenibacillus mucilaginosus TaxID=61624 RepID=UPI003D1E08F8
MSDHVPNKGAENLMPIQYGVLKCKAVDCRKGVPENAHYQVHAVAEGEDFRLAVNVRSQLSPSELLYYADEHFQHAVTEKLAELPYGFTKLEGRPGGAALDFIRSNLFDPKDMVPLPFEIPGQDNDLNEKCDFYIRRALAVEDAVLYVFGEEWGPEPDKPDKIFGFRPGRGVHNIHMNQGNHAKFQQDDGVYQDGALLIHFPSEGRWIGLFLAFQSQTWHTDDRTGHRIGEPVPAPDKPDRPGGKPSEPDGPLFIVGAVVRPEGAAGEGRESVTLLNASPEPVDLAGWSLANRNKQKHPLGGVLAPGQFLTVPLDRAPGGQEFLRNKGDIITLLDPDGLKVHGVSYTQGQVREGWTLLF